MTISPEEFDAAMRAKGWVRMPSGWVPPSRILGAGGGVESRHADSLGIGADTERQAAGMRSGPPFQKSQSGSSAPPARTLKRLLNKTEARYKAIMLARGITGIMDQAITLRLDPPYKSYRADLAYLNDGKLCLVEVKGPHRFRAAGIAKAALAAKTYPQFRFELAEWTGHAWKESVLSP